MPDEMTCKRARKVEDIRAGCPDYAGICVECVYLYNPPDYAVYRTPARVTVQFADDKGRARVQRQRINCLTPLRGQINGLIDGWRDEGMENSRGGRERRRREAKLRKRAVGYDRRVADAIVTGLQDDVQTARALLAEVKNDIIGERTTMARSFYMWLALVLVVAIIGLMGVLSSALAIRYGPFGAEMTAVWTAVSGGTLGAFFSIAIGLKGRTVLIDLRNTDNASDAILRILIGAIAGGMMLCVLRSGLVSTLLKGETLDPSDNRHYSDLLVFAIGFVAGFFERLVPDVLAQTNLGTTEHPVQGTVAGGAPVGLGPQPPQPAAPGPAPALEQLDNPPADEDAEPANPGAEPAELAPADGPSGPEGAGAADETPPSPADSRPA
jgi:hypothetical protein